MIVIDVGCARYTDEVGDAHDSITRLLEMYDPDVLYGFDPNWQPWMGNGSQEKVVVHPAAVWSYEGEIGFRNNGLSSWITDQPDATKYRCIDLAKFIRELPKGEEIVLKLDAEGAEFELLEHLMAQRVDQRLRLVWVEWHNFGLPCPTALMNSVISRLGCEYQEWR